MGTEVINFYLQRPKLLLLSVLEQRTTAVGGKLFGKLDFFFKSPASTAIWIVKFKCLVTHISFII